MDYSNATPETIRQLIRNREFMMPTSGVASGYAQGNLVILPKEYAYDFLLFAYRNPKPCPLLYVSDTGEKHLDKIAAGSNIYTDIGNYNIYRDGKLVENIENVEKYHSDDLVSFIIGCSFTFESELVKEGIRIPHIEKKANVAMYDTNIRLEDSGVFSGNMVVSMRPIKARDVSRAVMITSSFAKVHGAPVHVGNPADIGIDDITKPDYGDFVGIEEDEVPVFWACGVTPQNALRQSKIPFAITHGPGYMFVTGIKNSDLITY
ncbi:Uncharacterized protein YcsI, UPF0317 family [Dethiosulfatibacter aminovorans DSM 17477]|uniref:Putative hydro-lyase SAMN02745751_01989 n=1 Tax=Dethiosulfatibacter aminovorans DSM 17477 TaxID=1121476 RepID=A0A1M6HED3_9FIRM|nr:putative hydro-lyase [Dethiosulfatibacter aminovorans]SHJ20514.1 Uncharacterized protein YcsI, UPF0317 family [Dethiosulfatibacter aminovorans DSM 17477]